MKMIEILGGGGLGLEGDEKGPGPIRGSLRGFLWGGEASLWCWGSAGLTGFTGSHWLLAGKAGTVGTGGGWLAGQRVARCQGPKLVRRPLEDGTNRRQVSGQPLNSHCTITGQLGWTVGPSRPAAAEQAPHGTGLKEPIYKYLVRACQAALARCMIQQCFSVGTGAKRPPAGSASGRSVKDSVIEERAGGRITAAWRIPKSS